MVNYLPSAVTRQVTILEFEYSTSITISSPPVGSEYTQGAQFPFSGRLVFREGGTDYGLNGRTINLSYNGSFGSAVTDSNGYWSKSVSIPNYGTYTLRASYAGESGLAASEASRTVGGALALDPVLLLAALAGGYFLLRGR